MNRDREMGMAVMAAMVLWVVIALLAMCSCSGRKVITETIVTRDTIHITHSDTVSIDRWLTHHDTLRIETERVVTLVKDTVGRIDTVRVESNTFHWQHIADEEGESKLMVKVDSVLKVLDKQHNRETVKEKARMPWWGWLTIGGSLALGSVGILASRK